MAFKPIDKYKLKLPDTEEYIEPAVNKVVCPSCKTEVPPEDINIQQTVGKCCDCGGIFSFADQLPKHSHLDSNNEDGSKDQKQKLDRPEGINVFQSGDSIEYDIQAGWSEVYLCLLFILVSMAILFTTIWAIDFSEFVKWIAIGFWLPSLLVGFQFWPFRRSYNLYISDGVLSIHKEPSISKKPKEIFVQEISQLYVKRNELGYPCLYAIIDGVKGQRHQQLLSIPKSLHKVKYLEQELEIDLGIENRKVIEVI